MKKIFITNRSGKTKKLGELLARELKGGEILALQGELGAGKTNFAQGILCGLGAKGPFTSPTFIIMKQYKIESQKSKAKGASGKPGVYKAGIQNSYHVDAYRIKSKDILNLGWKEIIMDKNNVIIIEWADRVKKIIPKGALWIKFEWIGENERKITFKANN